MKKRLFATFLSLCMVISLLPVTALAEGETKTDIGATTATLSAGSYILNDDVTLTNSALTIESNATVTIDLNGHKLTNKAGEHTIVNNGTLTITDSVGGGVVDNVSHAKAAIMNNNGATCTILAGQFTRSQENGQSSTNNGGNSYYTINNYGTMTFGTEDGANNITVTANGNYSSLVHNGWQSSSDATGKTATMTIYGGTFTGGINTIKNDESGTLTINGGTFNNVTQYAVQNWNTAIINGGTFESSTMAAIYNGADTAGTSDGQLTITGGKFTAAANNYVVFSKTGNSYTSNTYSGASASISGGAYSNKYVSNTYDYENDSPVVVNADGTCEVKTENDVTSLPQDSTGRYYADTDAAEANNAAKITEEDGTTTYYASLSAAIAAADAGDTVTLLKNVTISVPSGTGTNTGAINITKNITLDGNGKTITAGSNFTGQEHIINVTSNATIKDLTIVGNKNTKHGINVWAAAESDTQPNVTVTDVTIQNCGTAAMVVNNSKVTATELNTKGNTWGAVNVDNSGEFNLVSGNLEEDSQIWSEDAGKDDGSTIKVPKGSDWTSVTVNNVGTDGKEDVKTHYTTDMSKLGEAAVFDGIASYTVYDTVERALAAVKGDKDAIVIVMQSASIEDESEIPEGVTLNIWPDVILTIGDEGTGTLTNNGTINNRGKIEGTVENGANGTLNAPHTLSFNANGGTYSGSTMKPMGGNTIDLPKDIPTRAGYTFLGWSYNGKLYQPGGSFTMPNADVTLVAQWSKNASPAPSYSVTTPTSANGTVTVSPSSAQKNATVTITVKPDTGYQLAGLTVTDASGNRVPLTQKSDTQYTFTMPASKVTVKATFEEIPQIHVCPAEKFTDVDTTQWYHEAIDYVIEAGMMNGVAADKFAPNSTTTRGMIVTILYRLEGEPAVAGASAFTDVESGAWYADPIAWAAAKGVVNGTSPTTFDPNDPITREQMAAILYRYASYKGYDVAEKADLSSYTDAGQISAYAADAMAWANAEGLITGVTKTTLEPQGNATRAQVATILMRFCENVVK